VKPEMQNMYGQHDPSVGPKTLLVTLHAMAVAGAAWFLFGGSAKVAALFGAHWPEAQLLRRVLLITLFSIYFLRLFATIFMQKRRVAYSEAAFIGVWIIIIDATMAALGGTHPGPIGWIGRLGVVLYAIGSYLNTASEYQRMRWKRRQENKGKIYTRGLFKYAMHINYFGDELLFFGLALVAGSPWALIIPAIMLCGFVFVNIPMLDKHLARHYGGDFQAYASRTARFVPFVY
jgi:steroid 5-alpha reductase family enzyme